ncbi:hypothetical protein CsSME_00028938 [Camellia sinensis var. sinensis]
MEESEIAEVGGLLGLPAPASLTVAIAINGNRSSKYIIKWALEKFVPKGAVMFRLLHVRPKITAVPTPSKLCLFQNSFGDVICVIKIPFTSFNWFFHTPKL